MTTTGDGPGAGGSRGVVGSRCAEEFGFAPFSRAGREVDASDETRAGRRAGAASKSGEGGGLEAARDFP
ncbi:MAG: hypothetical protein V3S64_08430 [bacterium]